MIVDPVINSDGRDAFAIFNHQHRGVMPIPILPIGRTILPHGMALNTAPATTILT
jgi:hypothetical protein